MKKLGIVFAAVLVLSMCAASAHAHGHGGRGNNGRGYPVCHAEGCEIARAHRHGGTRYCGQACEDGHRHHGTNENRGGRHH